MLGQTSSTNVTAEFKSDGTYTYITTKVINGETTKSNKSGTYTKTDKEITLVVDGVTVVYSYTIGDLLGKTTLTITAKGSNVIYIKK